LTDSIIFTIQDYDLKNDYDIKNTAVSGGVYIETYGCQMNLVDSEIVLSMLEESGYRRVETPEEAEIILVNTCAIRDHAVVKAISNVGRFKKLKQERPETRVGVLGCMSKFAADDIANQLPFLEWIMGPDTYRRLPSLLQQASPSKPLIIKNGSDDELYDEVLPSRREGINAWVTITRGCNNHCTYCVVPGARGPERHRPVESILQEVEEAVELGFPQITLLGQNVNSYAFEEEDFADLLWKVADVKDMKRVRFMTSHPKDCSEKLIDVIANHPKVCPELHLPFQAGSDRILKKMNRRYTSSHYRNLIDMARSKIDDILISTDIIVGFPGETYEEFLMTEQLVKDVGYDNAYIYKYSARANTPAFKLEDDVPDKEKVSRLMRLNEIVQKSGVERRKAQIGKTLEILVEGESSRSKSERMGRTYAGHVVVFPGEQKAGEFVKVRISELSGFTLRATIA